ncbi:MAG: helix-turn-helix transcriptional regulator [Bacilli bacterium]|jgi:transcriptional regulator with XRE-family HTH domain|nr:helix-turn-helix transcriptional regulator [Bacillota bacterium]OQC50003.1 MAG: helix-turn-helix protein [Tenericutes bacterium ADurb.Bin024]HOA11052.1 helix-turn-helix transcriptional regulator [Bacilli bacterium]TAH59323.1 MAG: XRE family transcriptional regulator [Bacillota bacterium]HOH95026.1 helix-turn-helix transcriptional regulator [Bacilli bacterium]
MYCEKLITLRRNRGLTQQQLADALMLSQSMISKIERGITRLDPMLAIRFADFYNVSLDYLFGRSERQLQISEKDIENLSEQDKNEMLAFIIKLINEKK